MLAIYFLPSFIAGARKTPRNGTIFIVNLLLGWTLVGWVVALVWSLAGTAGGRKCPHCAEPIQVEAKVCRHCHRDLLSA